MPPYQLVWRPDNGKRYVASLPWVCQMSHTGTIIWPHSVHPLPNVPRRHAARPVCIVPRQQDLDEVEQDFGQQVEKRITWPCIRLPMSGCWFGRTQPCFIRTRRCFPLHLHHAPHPETVWARWTGPKLHPFPPWTPSWIKIGVLHGRGLRRSSRLTRRPDPGPPLFCTMNRHSLCRPLYRHPASHSRNPLQTRWWPCSDLWCLHFNLKWKPFVVICRDRFRHWWRKPWRHTYHRYLDSLLLFFSCLFTLFVYCLSVAYTIDVPLINLPRLLDSCYCVFLSLAFIRLHQNHLLQSCPWPHHSWSHPPRWCLWTSPNRDLPGYNAHWFWFVHIDISVFIHLGRLQSFCIYVSSVLYCLICSVLVFGGLLSSSTSSFLRRPGRMWDVWRSRRLPKEGSHLPLHPASRPANGPDWTVPHCWLALWIRLGYAFYSCHSLSFFPHALLFIRSL